MLVELFVILSTYINLEARNFASHIDEEIATGGQNKFQSNRTSQINIHVTNDKHCDHVL